jgi:hypothetical protein
MMGNMQEKLGQYSIGRIFLHTICALLDHKWSWHWIGIKREIV